MSSDPKGPETTPLTAANAARAMTLLVMASRVDPNLRSAVADVESYIAELQREIEGYRQALEKAHGLIRQRPHHDGGCDCWFDDGDSNRYWIDGKTCEFARVLARKEAKE